MSAYNILFYSNKCEGSKLLISMMQSEKLLRFFHLICTDNNPKIPPQIYATPTIIIRGITTPYVAGDAFAWLAKVKQWKISMDIQRMNSAQQEYLKSINNNLVSNNNDVLGFSKAEMAAMSDIFSFFSKNISQECQDALNQSYFTYQNLGHENIFTPPLEDGTYKASKNNSVRINESKQKELFNKLKQERNKQDIAIKQNIENFINQYGKK